MKKNSEGEELWTLDELKTLLVNNPHYLNSIFKVRLHVIVDIYNKYLEAITKNTTQDKRIKELEFKVASLELETAGNRFVIIA